MDELSLVVVYCIADALTGPILIYLIVIDSWTLRRICSWATPLPHVNLA